MVRASFALLLCAGIGTAQTTLPAARRIVRAVGEASVNVRPDQARINVSVVTQAATAQEAAQQNATRSTTLIEALRSVLGANAEIRTLSYTLNPNYTYPRDAPPVLTGFTATNTLEVTIPDLNIIGRVIDTAINSGATRVDGLRLTIRDEEPARAQALRTATQRARTKAEAMAQGLGARLGQVLAVEEGSAQRIVPIDRGAPVTGATTPIETGTLEVRATAVVEFELL